MVRKDVFLTALVITLAVFALGYYLGVRLDTWRVDDVTNKLTQSVLDTESLVAEREFLTEFGGNSCTALKPRFLALDEQLVDIGNTLARYDAKKVTGLLAYDVLKRKYFVLEMRVMMLLHKLFYQCSYNVDPVVIFFYDVSHDQDSLNQGYVLDKVRSTSFPRMRVFSFDREFVGEPLLETLEAYYNVTSSPTLVLNFDTVYSRYVSETELVQLLQ